MYILHYLISFLAAQASENLRDLTFKMQFLSTAVFVFVMFEVSLGCACAWYPRIWQSQICSALKNDTDGFGQSFILSIFLSSLFLSFFPSYFHNTSLFIFPSFSFFLSFSLSFFLWDLWRLCEKYIDLVGSHPINHLKLNFTGKIE